MEDQFEKSLLENDLNPYGSATNPNSKTSTNIRKMKNCEILLINKPSQLNKKLIKFFNENLNFLNQNGLVFDWIVVFKSEIELYKEQNINKFPVLIVKNQHITGIDSIINFLLDNVESNRPQRVNKKNISIQNDDDLKDFYMNELTGDNNGDNIDETDNFSNSISQRVAEMNKNREKHGLHPSSTKSNPEIHEANNNHNKTSTPRKAVEAPILRQNNIADTSVMSSVKKSTTTNNADDDMMEKFWENMEETEL